MTYVATITSQGQVTIPAAIRRHKQLSNQNKIVFHLDEKKEIIYIKPAKNLEDVFGILKPKKLPKNTSVEQIIRQETKRGANRAARKDKKMFS